MFCTKMRQRIRHVMQQFDAYVDAHAETALQITTALKHALESPVADMVTLLIPGTADDALKQHLQQALVRVTDTLLVLSKCSKEHDMNKKLQCLAGELLRQTPEVRDALLHKMASLLTGELDGNRLKQRLYDLYVQAKYTSMK
jgi:hypothetical protein